ncbi:hypothetical protein SKAU_G00286900 [Synaphobranchus kaupii]|uniref:Uncharacterized protein n=1 Tax=Synaphobranchus kaupii TaxID=118154 RepID=A0A9Q1INK0_SYNKA|nr:hypothetical protein SKAU_G00286900 [Synaphobranchus kaupii]
MRLGSSCREREPRKRVKRHSSRGRGGSRRPSPVPVFARGTQTYQQLASLAALCSARGAAVKPHSPSNRKRLHPSERREPEQIYKVTWGCSSCFSWLRTPRGFLESSDGIIRLARNRTKKERRFPKNAFVFVERMEQLTGQPWNLHLSQVSPMHSRDGRAMMPPGFPHWCLRVFRSNTP